MPAMTLQRSCFGVRDQTQNPCSRLGILEPGRQIDGWEGIHWNPFSWHLHCLVLSVNLTRESRKAWESYSVHKDCITLQNTEVLYTLVYADLTFGLRNVFGFFFCGRFWTFFCFLGFRLPSTVFSSFSLFFH